MSNTNPHQNEIEAGYFYCPYVPLQTHSVYGVSFREFGIIYDGVHYGTIHALWAAVIRKEARTLRSFVKDMMR